ncbi:DUF6600 domain-containing protein [Dyadobacter arcticus]|uniref:YXWGXW repeat-containing protein n=1 Tax=Dyadobacter arcticus TaxID=1078754 RepID=A0ABX0UHR9_9BACT|nr:DUF6600 domain-containing protein [Dyadobacter arcticus]NIJ51584.1 hypothetical protein [Dyadobacter arcticus]
MNTMRTLRILGLFSLMLGGVAVSNTTQAQPGFSVSFETFYNDLSPYGRWVRNPQYGSVWIPDVPRGFQPYSTDGYWEVTEYGNTWVSDYDWGWAPFHYGRWSFDDYNGWFWVPDYEWGPAWVNWRSGGGYYGWAPLGPGISINVSFNAPSFWWNFVPQRYITYRGWRNYCAPQRRFTQVYNQTVIINNYYRSNNRTYVYGPRRDEIERVTRRSVPVRTIDASASGRGRVIVAESGRGNDPRGNDRYNSRDNNTRGNDSRGNDRNSRNEPDRRGAVIDAGSDRSNRGNNDYNSRGRNERSDNSRIGDNSDNSGRGNDRSGNVPTIPSPSRDDSRSNRSRSSEPSVPAESRNDRYEEPRQSQPSREQSVPNYGSERSNRSNRSSESPNSGANRGSYESPQRSSRVERSAEPRGNERSERSSQPSQQRSTTERSSRSPR